jgi:hypothetical protein
MIDILFKQSSIARARDNPACPGKAHRVTWGCQVSSSSSRTLALLVACDVLVRTAPPILPQYPLLMTFVVTRARLRTGATDHLSLQYSDEQAKGCRAIVNVPGRTGRDVAKSLRCRNLMSVSDPGRFGGISTTCNQHLPGDLDRMTGGHVIFR